MNQWTKAIELQSLKSKGKALFRQGPKQIALFLSEDKIYAIDNRCPHEGYPLIEGTIAKTCILTCNWHNWKFDLSSGKNLFAQDNVRNYPTKIESGDVYIDLAPPSKKSIERAVLEDLKSAYLERDYGRMARELYRLKFNGIDPLVGIKQAIIWSFEKFEYGMGHAYAAAADWLTLYDEEKDNQENQMIALVEILDHISEDTLRENTYPYANQKVTFSHVGLLSAIEAEDTALAESYIHQAFEGGVALEKLKESLGQAALSHFFDFGHSAIYVIKVYQLIDTLGMEVAKPLLLSLVRSLCYATREDLLPEFRQYQRVLDEKETTLSPPEKLYGASVPKALAWVQAQWGKQAPEEIYQQLLTACSQHLTQFDESLQFRTTHPVSDNVGWLSFTHALTFANAVRHLCETQPKLWRRGLLQMACFLGRNHRYLLDEQKDWSVANPEQLFTDLTEKLFDHGLRWPLISSHLLKTFQAVRDEYGIGTPATRVALIAAINRLFHATVKEKHARRSVNQAYTLVARDF